MTPVELKKKLHSGDTVIGTLIASPSPVWPRVIKNCDLDFLFIDTEHIALDRSQVSWMCRTYSAMGLPPIVRLKSPDPYEATMVLDDGAAGIISPYTESVEQVLQLRGATKIRPLKGGRMNEILGGAKLERDMKKYLSNFNKNNILVLNIESLPALNALDQILDVPEIDAVQIGPHDLTTNLGIPEQYDHPLYLKTIEEIFKKARAKGIGAGIHAWGDIDYQVRLLNMGANMLIHKGDIMLVQQGLTSELGQIRSKLNPQRKTKKAKVVSV